MQRDTLHLAGINLPDGTVLGDDWYTVRGLNDIEAIYEINNGRIAVVDHGILGQDDDNAIMTEAPCHYLVMSGEFNGNIQLEEKPDFTFVFENNQLVNIK